MNVRFTPRAESEAERKRKWWRKNRDKAPDLLDDELADAIERIRANPSTIGAIFESDFPSTVRRVLMKKTKNNVFFAVIDGEIVILSIWALRGSAGRSCSRARRALDFFS